METLRFSLGIRFDLLTEPVNDTNVERLLGELCSAVPAKLVEGLLMYGGVCPLGCDGDGIYTVVFTKGSIKKMRALYAHLQKDAVLRGMLNERLPYVQNNVIRNFEGMEYFGEIAQDGTVRFGSERGLRFVEKTVGRIPFSDKNSIIVVPNSFKGTFDQRSAAAHIRSAVRQKLPYANVITIPAADGGDGTLSAVESLMQGFVRSIDVTGPYGKKVPARYFAYDGRAAVIESALACGLALCKADELDLPNATSRGVGELILRALHEGLTDIRIGLGGSATNDCGIGAACALGFKFLDAEGGEVTSAADMASVVKIDDSAADPFIKKASFTLMCDVDNPLTGPSGATYTFGPQKGGEGETLDKLEVGMLNMAKLLDSYAGRPVSEESGSGAAGGLGAAFMALLGAKYSGGADALLDMSRFESKLKKAAVVITGEGRIDATSIRGKATGVILRRAAACGVPAALIAGSRGDGAGSAEALARFVSYCPEGVDREAALDEAAKKLIDEIADKLGL